MEILELIARLNREGLTVVAILHDLALAGRFAHRIVGMCEGRIAFDGAPQEVLQPEPLERVFGCR